MSVVQAAGKWDGGEGAYALFFVKGRSQKYYAFDYNYSPDSPRLKMVRLNDFSTLQWFKSSMHNKLYEPVNFITK